MAFLSAACTLFAYRAGASTEGLNTQARGRHDSSPGFFTIKSRRVSTRLSQCERALSSAFLSVLCVCVCSESALPAAAVAN